MADTVRGNDLPASFAVTAVDGQTYLIEITREVGGTDLYVLYYDHESGELRSDVFSAAILAEVNTRLQSILSKCSETPTVDHAWICNVLLALAPVGTPSLGLSVDWNEVTDGSGAEYAFTKVTTAGGSGKVWALVNIAHSIGPTVSNHWNGV